MKLDSKLPLLITTLGLGLASPGALAAAQTAVRVEINRSDYPHARCNDDTQATYYLRGAGPDGAVSGRKWLIFLHGGGSCSSDEACAERWYDPDGGPDGIIGYHGNMTADPDLTKNFNGEGLLDFDGVDSVGNQGINPFTGFNRIMVPYCSSDTYSGRNTASRAVNYAALLGTAVTIGGETKTLTNPAGLPPLTTIRFSGQHIVEAVVDLVMNGGIKSGRKTGNGADTFVEPPSAADDEIVLSGSSAGGSGVIRNLDNIARNVRTAAANVKVFGIDVWERNAPEEKLKSADEFWKKKNFSFPTLVDADDKVIGAYGFRGIPATVIIGPDGTIASVHQGFDPEMPEKLKAEVEKLLEKKG